MSRVYVVREGKIRGEGRYRASGIPAWTGGRWAPTIKDAFRFTSRSMAMRNARKCKGRPVRIVTLSEQLRRAKKRIAELEEAAAMGGAELNRLRFDKALVGVNEQLEKLHTRIASATPEYQQGRSDERAAVVACLRGTTDLEGKPIWEVERVADHIESGEHVKGGG